MVRLWLHLIWRLLHRIVLIVLAMAHHVVRSFAGIVHFRWIVFRLIRDDSMICIALSIVVVFQWLHLVAGREVVLPTRRRARHGFGAFHFDRLRLNLDNFVRTFVLDQMRIAAVHWPIDSVEQLAVVGYFRLE